MKKNNLKYKPAKNHPWVLMTKTAVAVKQARKEALEYGTKN